MRTVFAFAMFLASCGQKPAQANPCATRPATYLSHYIEKSGTCGVFADAIVNVNADGTIPGEPLRCDAITQDGCTARNTGCRVASGSTECKLTTSITFVEDGSTASGLATIACDGPAACVSTYDVTMTRQ